MQKPLEAPVRIALIVPTYNQKDYIGQAVQSILDQTLRPGWHLRVVVADDCSQDGTADVVRELSTNDPQKQLILRERTPEDRKHAHRTNGRGGGKDNLRAALASVDADYYGFCEGDDYWISREKLLKQVDYLLEHPDTNVMWTQAHVVDPSGNFLRATRIPMEIAFDDMKFGNIVGDAMCSILWRASALDPDLHRVCYPTSYGDISLILNLLMNGGGVVIDEPLVARRIHPGGVWSGENQFLRIANKVETVNFMSNIHKERYESNEIREYLMGLADELRETALSMLTEEDRDAHFRKQYQGLSRRHRLAHLLREIIRQMRSKPVWP